MDGGKAKSAVVERDEGNAENNKEEGGEGRNKHHNRLLLCIHVDACTIWKCFNLECCSYETAECLGSSFMQPSASQAKLSSYTVR